LPTPGAALTCWKERAKPDTAISNNLFDSKVFRMTPAQRPLSPHLQVYKFQLTSVLSIMHRATGLALSVGTVFLVWWLLAAARGDAAYAKAQWFWGSWLGILMLLGWTASLFFHLCNGIRHLFWDGGHGYELPTVYRSGWSVVIATAVLTVIAWIAGLSMLGGPHP
jgi:succinate dehydrogenase / fumarate reductase cytochrome b subunit